jgi:P22 coat protein - gene protein 5
VSNTLTNLIPDLYEALDVVSRELVGIIPAVSRSSSIARAALNETVRIPVTPTATTATNTPAVNAPDTGDQTIDNVTVTISKSKHVPVRWNGEETKGLMNAGTFSTIEADRFYQAMRALVNEVEADLWTEAATYASRAYGAVNTIPFASAANMSDLAGVRRIIEENGAPLNDLQLVLGHAAMANLRGLQSNLFKVNEAGTADMLRNGMTDRLMGFAIRHSNAVGGWTAGAGTGYDVNLTAGYAVGATTIAVNAGTVNTTGIKAGDMITFAGDTNKYLVVTGTTATGGNIVIAKPGLRQALAQDAELTITAAHTRNVAFARSAIVLATRAPAVPVGGDSADDALIIQDPMSGLAFEVAVYRQFLQTVYHVRMAWGWKAIKQDHIALLIGSP